MMNRSKLRGISVFACGAAALIVIGGIASRGTAQAGLHYLDQGNDWTEATRTEFYSKDQGSQIIKLAWLQALRQEDGQPFLADGWRVMVISIALTRRSTCRSASSGVLTGAPYGLGKNLQLTDKRFNILAASVTGSLAERFLHNGLPKGSIFGPLPAWPVAGTAPIGSAKRELLTTYDSDAANRSPREAAHPYEARVLRGIWATAPYLHNGSVPTLAQLLTPPDQRVRAFEVGADYDMDKIGLAERQSGWHETRTTTGCEDRHSGNSHCGHDYGT